MIDYIKGNIAELNPAYAVIDNHGIGYMLNISLLTYDGLATIGQGNEAKLGTRGFPLTYLCIRRWP